MDVVDLREFYAGPLGHLARRLIGRALARHLKPQSGQTVVGLGYASDYLEDHVPAEALSLSFMMARQGVIHWPAESAVRSCLVDECDLPLLESVADHMIVVHGLELADSPLDMLQEIWRVLAPQGKLMLVVPNRRGVWSASESTPFGYGQPFSRSQLASLLKEARFSAMSWNEALFVPPVARPSLLKAGESLERVGLKVAGRFAGVIVVEAMKQVYAFSSGKRARRLMPRFRPILLPSPSSKTKASREQ